MLGALADNGGLTPTLALLSGSPAIDHGDNTPVFPGSFDQRGPGFARIVNHTVDIGAFENSANGPVRQRDPDGSGERRAAND